MSRELARIPLASLPTPLEPMPRLSKALGGTVLYIKRDDLTGLAGGGNKTRKLELIAADALARRSDSFITVGSAQSNHCRQTAAAAAKCGVRCILVLRGDPPETVTGNLLLDQLLGAEIRWSGSRSREEVMEEVVQEEKAAGRTPYPIVLGGSNAMGASAYAAAVGEMMSQVRGDGTLADRGFDRILFASSSGGTHAGLAAGAFLRGFRGEVLGISIDQPLATLQEVVAGIATGVCTLLGRPRIFRPQEISACADYLGDGYGVLGPGEREAIDLFARLEGILLDPVYTARAAAAMIDLIRKGVISSEETLLFWHTGGQASLWAYARELAPPGSGAGI